MVRVVVPDVASRRSVHIVPVRPQPEHLGELLAVEYLAHRQARVHMDYIGHDRAVDDIPAGSAHSSRYVRSRVTLSFAFFNRRNVPQGVVTIADELVSAPKK